METCDDLADGDYWVALMKYNFFNVKTMKLAHFTLSFIWTLFLFISAAFPAW